MLGLSEQFTIPLPANRSHSNSPALFCYFLAMPAGALILPLPGLSEQFIFLCQANRCYSISPELLSNFHYQAYRTNSYFHCQAYRRISHFHSKAYQNSSYIHFQAYRSNPYFHGQANPCYSARLLGELLAGIFMLLPIACQS